MVNLILGCKFWIKLCKSIILLHECFQNMKQSSRYLFHDLINSVFIFLLYFHSNFKYANVWMVYVGAILVPTFFFLR